MAWSAEGDYIAAVLRILDTPLGASQVLVFQGATCRLLMQHTQDGPACLVWSPVSAFLMVGGFGADGLGYLLDVAAGTNEAVLAGCITPRWSPNAQFWATKHLANDGEHLPLVGFHSFVLDLSCKIFHAIGNIEAESQFPGTFQSALNRDVAKGSAILQAVRSQADFLKAKSLSAFDD